MIHFLSGVICIAPLSLDSNEGEYIAREGLALELHFPRTFVRYAGADAGIVLGSRSWLGTCLPRTVFVDHLQGILL